MPPVHIPPTLTCIGVQLTKMTAVAVVSRLVTDTFDVPQGGCVVKSSVCNDVTLYFPKGAVDRSIIGSLQVTHTFWDVFIVIVILCRTMAKFILIL